MTEGSDPITRFSVIDEVEGWTNFVISPAPILKLCQLMTAWLVDWLIWVRFAAGWVMVALPATTEPPAGLAAAGAAKATAAPLHRAVLMTSARAVDGAGRVGRLGLAIRTGRRGARRSLPAARAPS